jgi:hypothetical protein
MHFSKTGTEIHALERLRAIKTFADISHHKEIGINQCAPAMNLALEKRYAR